MDILEQIGKLAGGREWGGFGRSTSPDRRLTGEIAALFAGCDPFGTDLLFARYAMDAVAHSKALETWTRYIEQEYRRVPIRAYRWHWLADGTLSHWIAGDTCAQCDGVGSVMLESKLVDCEMCAGRGRKDRSDRRKLKAIGIARMPPRSNYIDWIARYDECMTELDRIAAHTRDQAQQSAKTKALIFNRG